MKDKLKIIITAIVILSLIAINLIIFISNNQAKERVATTENTIIYNNRNMTVEEETIQTKKNTDIIIDQKIASMSEGDRAKAYFGKFVKAIEEKHYELAYSYLNENYKAQYFPELTTFEEYIKTEFPQNKIVVKYNSVEPKGEIFVLSVTLKDIDDEQESQRIRTVVIREKGTNQFTISFSK